MTTRFVVRPRGHTSRGLGSTPGLAARFRVGTRARRVAVLAGGRAPRTNLSGARRHCRSGAHLASQLGSSPRLAPRAGGRRRLVPPRQPDHARHPERPVLPTLLLVGSVTVPAAVLLLEYAIGQGLDGHGGLIIGTAVMAGIVRRHDRGHARELADWHAGAGLPLGGRHRGAGQARRAVVHLPHRPSPYSRCRTRARHRGRRRLRGPRDHGVRVLRTRLSAEAAWRPCRRRCSSAPCSHRPATSPGPAWWPGHCGASAPRPAAASP